MQVRSALRSLIPGIVVGVASTNGPDRIIVFRARDYDNCGNVSGPVLDVTSDRFDAFYALGYESHVSADVFAALKRTVVRWHWRVCSVE